MEKETVSVEISKDLYERIERYIKENGGFSSVREFIEFVVNEVLEGEEEGGYSSEEEEEIKERLRSLGYL